MQTTSLDAWQGIQETLGKRQKVVYNFLKHLGPSSNIDISKKMGLPINQVTPRMLELRKKGKVVDAGTKTCEYTGKTVKVWRVA